MISPSFAAAESVEIGMSWWLVVAATLAAFVGAALVARRLQTAAPRPPIPGNYDAPVIDAGLLDPSIRSASEPPLVRFFEVSFLVVLMSYAFFDRGFAWLHIPGTPLFIGELVLVLGAASMLAHPAPVLTAIRRSPSLRVLGLFMAWGFALLVLLGARYGVDAVRDSVLWYYGAVSILVTFLLISDPRRIQRWMKAFSRVIPWLIGWLFVAIVMDALLGSGPPYAPDSKVSIFSHSAGNSGVIMVICLTFVWLVDRDSKYFTPTMRLGITSMAGALLLFVALKNRGGFVAGAIGIILILVFLNKHRLELVVTLVGIATLLASIALVSQVSIALFGSREISAEQFFENVTSIINPSAGGHRQTSTTEWRLELWSRVLADVNSEFPLTGYGPGPDLGKIYNVTTNVDVPLRNPHNSHVGVIARLGWVGFGLWVVMWSVWALLLLDLRSRLARQRRPNEAGLIGLPLVAAAMILVNAFFDPSIEGPQVGFWLWFVFGLGAALQLIYHGFPELTRNELDPASDEPRGGLVTASGGSSG